MLVIVEMAVALHFVRHQHRQALRREQVFRDLFNAMDVLDNIEIISRYHLDLLIPYQT